MTSWIAYPLMAVSLTLAQNLPPPRIFTDLIDNKEDPNDNLFPTTQAEGSPGDTKKGSSPTVYIVVGVIVFVLIVVSLAIFMICFLRRRKAKRAEKIAKLENSMMPRPDDFITFIQSEYSHLDSRYIIEYNNLKLLNIVGEGNFGLVYCGELTRKKGNESEPTTKVAIKMLKEMKDSYRSFLDEGETMLKFKHPNILELEGVSFLPDRTPLIITPFMDNGSLLNYIKKNNCCLSLLLRFAKEISSGMMYMHSLHYMHRDLAARNCMLDASLQIRICDFGLTKAFESYTTGYCPQKMYPVAVHWMPIEIFAQANNTYLLTYTYAGDIWAFGVLLWELFSRGAQPYAGMNLQQLKDYLFAGKRLQQPINCEDRFYAIMMSCWTENPEERPEFTKLYNDFKSMLKDIELLNIPKDSPLLRDRVILEDQGYLTVSEGSTANYTLQC